MVAQATIAQLTGIRRSPTQIRAFLKRIGMQVRKVGAMPGRAHDPVKQQEQDMFHLYSQYHATFPEFRTALETFLTTAQREHRIELETLLAWNFQSFRSVQTLPA